MQQSHGRSEARQVCLEACCPTPLLGLPDPRSLASRPQSSSSVSRRNFASTATSSIFPNTQFTNHESLPSLQQAFSEFIAVYSQYPETDRIDQIRARDYFHLSLCNYTCLDYIGIGLFSYSQLHNSDSSSSPRPRDDEAGSTSSHVPRSDFPFFSISYKTGSLQTQLLHGGQESELESLMKKRIMRFLNISETDYSMVLTANRTSAFKLVAESYPFQSSRKLLTVYDYESEAVEAMINSSEKRGAHVMTAEFVWPRLRIHTSKLKNMVVRMKKKKRDKRGLFVFPVHSRVTGARYPYLWMNMAQENGWHVLLDACALGPKDMDSFGLSLIRPDFVVSSFYKVFGENPSGFGCLFVKKSAIPILETSTSLGIVSLIPAVGKKLLQLPGESSDDISNSSSFSGPIPMLMDSGNSKSHEVAIEHERPENSAAKMAQETDEITKGRTKGKTEIKCDGLDHVDSLGMILIGNRGRCLINWLVNALMKLEHPNREGARLIRIYGPKIKFDRGPALAFNVFDWKGEKIEPPLVQKLADRSNISLSYGFLHHIWFSDKYDEEKAKVLEKRSKGTGTGIRKEKADQVVMVVTLALSFLTNFEDVYKLWAFVAQFLDADFVEKERWRYTALNQKMMEV
ncbi:molybdenum cofactor sulfurase [Punica granatum]|uniref:Uncharacterized protein n=2 Tax=Punica granatum TaxID=22663 RepID=A0A218WTG0_PUNGR|nr:molybdenum cofactor sulfurase [Punica granatum]OWM75650.1 hypothetical protein CDL15_Pgr021815 [Punica granatum]PKI38351.1 hypothetical protein CRG98_041262 [Punica granatum]